MNYYNKFPVIFFYWFVLHTKRRTHIHMHAWSKDLRKFELVYEVDMKFMKFRLYVLAFCVVVFSLTAIGLTALYTRLSQPQILWLPFAYVIAISCTYTLLVQPLLTGERKLSSKKMILLAFSMIIIGGVVTHSVWTIITPKWSFSVAADKSTYILGENVKIATSLRNLGFITHLFRSSLSDPVVVSVEYQPTQNPTETYQVWYSPYHWKTAEFSIGSNESLERNFIWNQTNTANPWFWDVPYMAGTYEVFAWIQDAEAEIPVRGAHTLFIAYTSFNVTSA